MKRILPIIFTIVLAFSSISGALCADTGWVLEQKSHCAGPFTAYITKSAIKVVSASHGWTVVARAPRWEVYAFNTDAHSISKTTVDGFRQSFFLSDKSVLAETSALYRNDWLEPTTIKWQQWAATRIVRLRGTKEMASIVRMKENPIPEQAASILCDLTHIPKSNNITLAVSCTVPTHKYAGLFFSYGDKKAFPKLQPAQKIDWLTTASCKSSPIPDNTFLVPKGYKTAKSMAEVWLNMEHLKQSLLDQLKE